MTKYIDLARALPPPTEEQTRWFAEFVTGAHSWYKHLRKHPPVPFVFYLDPNSGRTMVHRADGEVAFVDNVDEREAFHYTWQTTVSYREKFGFWNYHAPYGRSFQYRVGEDVADTAGSGLTVLSEELGWLEVPKGLALAGTALVSALMYGSSHTQWIVQHWGPDHEQATAFIDPPRAWRGELPHYDDSFAGLAEEIVEASGRLEQLWASEDYAREKIETHRELNKMYERAFAEPRPFDEVIPRDVSSAMHSKTEQAWEATESRRNERRLIRPLNEAIGRERQRQIAGMASAMNQFLAVLHGEGTSG